MYFVRDRVTFLFLLPQSTDCFRFGQVVNRIVNVLKLAFTTLLTIVLTLSASVVTAEELHQRFLTKLRDQRYFDVALTYLADLEKSPHSRNGFALEVPLERALLLQQSASLLAPKAPDRAKKLDEAEAAFRDFLDKQPNHARRSEGSLALGNLLLTRGEEAKNSSTAPADQPNTEASKFFSDAQSLFEKMQAELKPIIESMQGRKIDPKQTAQTALRERYRTEYRQAQLLIAYAIESRGRCQAVNSAAWKTDLATAAKAYTDFYDKEIDRVLLRYSAIFFRSGIQRDLEQTADAIDGYQRILENEGIDLLRPLQTKALTELVKLLATAKENKYPAAIDRAERWEKQLRPDERLKSETLDLKLAFAQARVDWAEQLLVKDPSDRLALRLRRDAREGLQPLVRIASHQEQARSLLAKIGVEAKPPASMELPKVKNFAEALAAAQERIDRIESSPLAILKEQLKTASPEDKNTIQQELAQAEAGVSEERTQAIELLQTALKMYKRSDDRDQLRQTRFRLGYWLAQDKRAWESIAIGEFLSRSNPGTDIGVDSASVALMGYGELLKEQDKPSSEAVGMLGAFAEYLVKTWPVSHPAQSAASALVRIAMINGNWSQAEQYLALVPTGSAGAASLRQDLGLVLYRQYLDKKAALATGADTTEIDGLRNQSIEMLKLGIEGLPKDEYDQRAIESKSILIRLLMNLGRSDEVSTIVSAGALSPLQLVRDNPALVKDRQALLNVYRTSLQVLIGGLTESEEQSVTLEEAQKIIGEIGSAAGTDADGKKLQTAIFVGLARDLKETLDLAKTPAKKEKIASGLALLLGQLVARADDFTTQYWAAQTLARVSESFDTSSVAGRQRRMELLASASSMFKKILEQEASRPGWVQPPTLMIPIRLEIGKGLAAQADFSGALDQFEMVLKENSKMVDVQIEAAKIYEVWAASGTPQAYQLAIEGGRPASRGNPASNTIWGWGKISQLLAGKPQFKSQFFDARYQLAFCRHKLAMSKTGNDKDQMLQRAIADITSTALGYPELGGAAMLKKFDELLRRIEQDAGKPPTGLPSLKPANTKSSTK